MKGKKVMGNLRKIGEIPVDSGQMMLVDPCYILADNNTKDERLNKLYESCIDVTCSDEMAGTIDLGAVCSTGYGDGSYPVYVDVEDGRISKMVIRFIRPNAWYEDDEEDIDW